jgi:hypothetical protein
MWGKRNPSLLLVGMQGFASLWKKNWRLLKNLNKDLSYDSMIPLLGIYPKECNTGYSRGTHVYCSTMHNSQVMETTKMPHH